MPVDLLAPRRAPEATRGETVGFGEVHVWTAATERLEATGELARFARVCSGEETRRRGRFLFARDRRAFLAAHGLVRLALSWCAPSVEPGSWWFRSGPHGRPEVAEPATGLDLRFNLSHTAEWVACAVARRLDCGIDVERVEPGRDHVPLAARTLTLAETRELALAAPELRPRRFVELWTLKEALAKAVGLGLSLPFDEVGFAVRPRGIDLATTSPSVACDQGRWHFEQWAPDDSHVAALAVRQQGEAVSVIHHDRPPEGGS